MLISPQRIEISAQAGYEALNFYRKLLREEPLPEWLDAPNRELVVTLTRMAVANSSPSVMHSYWAATQLEKGWQYHRTSDKGKKVSNLITSYHKLEPEQQQKVVLFKKTVINMYRSLRYVVDL